MNRKFAERIRLFVCVALSLTLLAGPFVLPGQAAEKVLKLKFSSFVGPAHPATKIMKEFVKELTETSNGKVEVQYYGSSSLGGAKEQWEITDEGMADMAIFCCGYTPAQFPLSLGVQLPFFSDSAKTGTKVIMELMKRGVINNEFSDVVYVFPIATTPAQIYSNKKIAKIEDFKGLRVIGGETILRDICDLLGATTINMSFPDIYLALQRKTGDAAVTSWAVSMSAWKWHEVVKYAVDISILSGWHCGIIMNKKSWNKVPADVQSKWEDLFSKYSMKIPSVYDELDAVMHEKWKKVPDVEVTEFPEAEKKKLAEMVIPVWQKWVDRNGKQGQEMYRAYVEVMKSLGKPVLVRLPGLYQD